MSSTIRFKFKAAKDFEVISFNGMGLRVFDLKRRVVEKRQMNKGLDFELQVTNANTSEGENPAWNRSEFPNKGTKFISGGETCCGSCPLEYIPSVQRRQCHGVKEHRRYSQTNACYAWNGDSVEDEEPRFWERHDIFVKLVSPLPLYLFAHESLICRCPTTSAALCKAFCLLRIIRALHCTSIAFNFLREAKSSVVSAHSSMMLCFWSQPYVMCNSEPNFKLFLLSSPQST